ncbi:MAG: CAP domain-containing protein [Pseudomonadota bacterium]
MRAIFLCLALTACVAAPMPDVQTRSAIAGDALSLASQERVARGLPPLRPDRRLAMAAREQAAFMARRGRLGHDGPGGSNVLQRVQATGVQVCHVAENVAAGQTDAAQVHGDWMGSAGHRSNILNRNMDSGAVVSVEDNGTTWWAMVLSGPC